MRAHFSPFCAKLYSPTSCAFRDSNCEKYFGGGPTRETRLFGVRWREGDSPEVIRLIVLSDKLDRIAGNALEGSQLRDDTGRNLNAAIISHEDDRTNQQLAI